MRAQIRAILEHHGQQVRVQSGERRKEMYALLQPARQKREQVPETVSPIGWMDERLWQYLGSEKVSPGDRLFWREMVFQVRSSRAYLLGEEPLYWWASLVPEREAAE